MLRECPERVARTDTASCRNSGRTWHGSALRSRPGPGSARRETPKIRPQSQECRGEPACPRPFCRGVRRRRAPISGAWKNHPIAGTGTDRARATLVDYALRYAHLPNRPRPIPVSEPSRRLLKAFGPRDDGRSTRQAGCRADANDALAQIAGNGAYICPNCGARDLTRIPRRLIDRFLALFTGVRRFRCTHVECSWEGNLRRKKSSSH